MTIINFNKTKEVYLVKHNILEEYTEDLLFKIIESNDIYVVTYPGSYTGIRKSISIVKAISIINQKINIYGINLIRDFGSIFGDYVVFCEPHILHFYNKMNNSIVLYPSFEDILNKNNLKSRDIYSNVKYEDSNIIDFSIKNIANNIKKINKNTIFQEYYDKFS